jgi:hypothetical protein
VAIPTTKAFQQKSDAAVSAELQAYNLSVQVTGYSSVSGKSVTFSDTPSVQDLEVIYEYFSGMNDWQVA